MQMLIQDRLPQLISILKSHKVKRAYTFGSALTEKFNAQSDIDFLVNFEDGMIPEDYSDNYFDLLFKLQDLFNRHVDLVSEVSLTNPYFIKSVNKTRQVIYE